MAYPNFSDPFILHTDASEVGLGAVLYQRQNGLLRVIAYGSRTLSPAEKNYYLHSGKLEFLALKWAICDQFRDYLYYAPSFTVYTDNNPLTYVLSSAKLNVTSWCLTNCLLLFGIRGSHHEPYTHNRTVSSLLGIMTTGDTHSVLVPTETGSIIPCDSKSRRFAATFLRNGMRRAALATS